MNPKHSASLSVVGGAWGRSGTAPPNQNKA
jgi:hypothetical protein